MRIRVAVPVAIALLLGAAGCGAWGDDDAELDAANAACNAMAQHRYTAAARRVNEAVVEDARWRDLAWAIRAIAYDW